MAKSSSVRKLISTCKKGVTKFVKKEVSFFSRLSRNIVTTLEVADGFRILTFETSDLSHLNHITDMSVRSFTLLTSSLRRP